MNNVCFNLRVNQIVENILKAKRDALKNKEKNKRKLKSRIIKENKEYMLLLTPKVLKDGVIKFDGRTYSIDNVEDKFIFSIQKYNMKKAVLFDSYDEIKEFAEDIKKESNFEIEYKLNEYKHLGGGNLTFYYYKKN